MSDKKIPPPPILPPSDFKLKKNFCLFHKAQIKGDIYTCPSCNTKYCMKCAIKARNDGKKCVKCKQMIFL